MTDFKTLMYSLAQDAAQGNFAFAASSNNPADLSFNNGANWSNQTGVITPSTSAGVNLLNIATINYGAIGAAWYFGSATKFDTICLHFSTGTDNTTRTVVWEYWDGSTWQTIAQSGATQRVIVTSAGAGISLQNNSLAQLKFHPNIYNDWATTSVNGGAALYYLRMRITVGPFTNCSLASVSIWDHVSTYGSNNFDTVYTTIDDVAFTDVTLVSRSGTAGAFTFTANTTNARLYLGLTSDNLMGMRLTPSTAGTVGTGIWEYWNGSAWAALAYAWFGTITGTSSAHWRFYTTNTGYVTFNGQPSGWATTTVNGVSRYWIRFRVTSNYTVSPIFGSLVALKATTLSKTVYSPETTSRVFHSVFAKLHVYNPMATAVGRFLVQARLGSGAYVPANIGSPQAPTATFTSVNGRLFSTTANDGVFTDETSDASNSTVNDVTVTNTVNSNIYFGFPNDVKYKNTVRTLYLTVQNFYAGGVVAWEYWNGSAWTAFTPYVANADVNLNQQGNTNISVQIPVLDSWVANTVNSFTGFFIRRRITTIYSTNGGSWTSVTFNLPIANETLFSNSGENNSSPFLVDLTHIFTSQFSGASQQLDLQVAVENVSTFTGDFPVIAGELFVTYQATEQTTRAKSVVIPLNSTTAVLTNTLTSIGSNQIPQLSTYLPEASKTIRNFYIVVTGQDAMPTTMATEFAMRLDADAARYTWAQYSGGVSGNLVKYIFTKDNVDVSTVHNIQMAVTSRLNVFKNFAMYAVVTYEYDAVATTRVINSLIIPFETNGTFLQQNRADIPTQVRSSFRVEEPGTINNERLGCYLAFTDLAGPTLSIKDKNDVSYTTLTFSNPLATCGGFRYGALLTTPNFSRGLNDIGVDMYGTSKATNEASCAYVSGHFVVNYHSDVAAAGVQAHNKTIFRLGASHNSELRWTIGDNRATNPFTNWFINTLGVSGEFYQNSALAAALTLDARFLLENAASSPTRALFGQGGAIQRTETLMYDNTMGDNDLVKKYPGDLHDHRTVNFFAGGNWFIDYGYFTTIGGLYTVAVCHEIAFAVSGSVLGYSGSGAGLVVTFYEAGSDEPLFTATTIAGGTFTAVWYDNVDNIYCTVYDATLGKGGRSASQIATVAFNINLSSGGPQSYAYGG